MKIFGLKKSQRRIPHISGRLQFQFSFIIPTVKVLKLFFYFKIMDIKFFDQWVNSPTTDFHEILWHLYVWKEKLIIWPKMIIFRQFYYIFVNKRMFRTNSLKKVFGEFIRPPKIFILKMVHYKTRSATFCTYELKL